MEHGHRGAGPSLLLGDTGSRDGPQPGSPPIRIRRRTTCTVPGHGTHCEPSAEKDNHHCRTTEERLAMNYELDANGPDEDVQATGAGGS